MAAQPASTHPNKPMLGIMLTLVAYLFFSIVDASAKWLVLTGLPVLQVVFIRYTGHFLISFGIMFRGGLDWRKLSTRQPGLVILRSILLLFGTVTNFMALQYLPLTLTSAIMFSAPVFVCLLSGPLLGERVGIWRWGAIWLGFVGVLVAIRPFDESFHWAMGLSLVSVFAYSLYLILTRKLSNAIPTHILQFYGGAVGTCVLFPFVMGGWLNPVGSVDWVAMILLGLFGWSGHEVLIRAFRVAEASRLTPFSYVMLLYMTIWSVVLFNDFPDIWTVAGATIIVSAGLVIWVRERRQAMKAKEVKATDMKTAPVKAVTAEFESDS